MNYYIGMVPCSDELYHYGVKGMKWGIRRYQNEDGTYTAAGRRRYAYDRDINDKSRLNIAKIRTGEARRRLDVAKRNNSTNSTRIAELQGRVRSAKRNEKLAKSIDKGAKRAAKGETIGGNNLKRILSIGAAYYGSRLMTKYLNKRLSLLSQSGRYTLRHKQVAGVINKCFGYTLLSAAGIYSIKKTIDNMNIRSYYTARAQGDSSIKRTGSTEYKDRVNSSR